MKSKQIYLLMYGHDEHLTATRKWVLQSRGYRVLAVDRLSGIASIPETPPVRLLLLCHSLSAGESASAIALATSRWPDIQHLGLVADDSRAPSGLLGQLLHTMDGPAKLISMVGRMVGADTAVIETTVP